MSQAIAEALAVDDLAGLVALETAMGLAADPLRRLAVLFGRLDPSLIAGLKDRLKLANQAAEHLRQMTNAGDRLSLIAQTAFGRALYHGDQGAITDAALIAHLRAGSPDAPTLKAFLDFARVWKDPHFPLAGADLAARGIAPGPEMGRLLSQVEAWWAQGEFQASRSACLAELDRRVAPA